MPMLGASESNTLMGVDGLEDVDQFDADVVIVGVPCATPYAGAAEYSAANLGAPQAIRDGLAMWAGTADRHDWDLGDMPLRGKQGRVRDLGDLATRPNSPEANRALIETTINAIARQGAVPIVLGGDDSVPVPVIKALGSATDNLTILQIDAHIDWRDDVAGERYGLSSVMRRASECPHVRTMVQVGARGLSSAGQKEIDDAKDWGVKFFPARLVHRDGIRPIVDAIPDGADVHINLDLDGLDPSIMPAVFVPAPGGLLYWHVLDIIEAVVAKARIRSMAVVEFVPAKDRDGTAALTAGRIVSVAIGSILKASA